MHFNCMAQFRGMIFFPVKCEYACSLNDPKLLGNKDVVMIPSEICSSNTHEAL